MFAYCNNNPTMCTDTEGALPFANTMVTDSGYQDWDPDPLAHTYGTICGQRRSQYADVSFGLSTIGNAGCGLLATYNAMWLLGRKPSLRSVKDYYETSLNPRWFGILPCEISNYFSDRGIKTTEVYSTKELEGLLQNGGVGIITFWNDSTSIFEGAHTVAVTCSPSGRFRIYNAYDRDTRYREYDSIDNYIINSVREGVFMSGYYISN